jgi:hypothetical protein
VCCVANLTDGSGKSNCSGFFDGEIFSDMREDSARHIKNVS